MWKAKYSKDTFFYFLLHVFCLESSDFDDREYPDEDPAPLKLFCNFSSNLPPGILSPGLPKVMDIPPALTPIDKENPWMLCKDKIKGN